MTDDRATPLITVDELAALLADERPPTLLDVRWRLGGPPGRELYQVGHLPGAVFVDLDRELAAPPGKGGRHPLPAAEDFEAAMRHAGVDGDRLVVVYDDADSTAAARAWWLLRYFGHPSVRVLDGGFRAWTTAGHAAESGPSGAPGSPGTIELPGTPSIDPAPGTPLGDFTASPGHLPLLDADGAAALAGTGLLLDARAGERYRGEVEPVDPVAGHIPGAVSAPTAENVNADGTFRPAADLAARFAGLGATADGAPTATASATASATATATASATASATATGTGTGTGTGTAGGVAVGVYCGSGVTAAHEALALTVAGIPAALYLGSWSDWITDPDRPVATGPELGSPA